MATIKDEILSIATEQGYEGDAPKNIAQAVNALGTVIGGGGSGGGVALHITLNENAEPVGKCEYTPFQLYDMAITQNIPIMFNVSAIDEDRILTKNSSEVAYSLYNGVGALAWIANPFSTHMICMQNDGTYYDVT